MAGRPDYELEPEDRKRKSNPSYPTVDPEDPQKRIVPTRRPGTDDGRWPDPLRTDPKPARNPN